MTTISERQRSGAAAVDVPRKVSGGGGFMNRQQKLAPYLFLAPFLLLFAVFGIYPIVKSLTLSLYATNGPRDEVFVGLKNYAFLLQDADFHTAVWNTVVFAFWGLALQVPAALGLAILLQQRWLRGREFFRWAFFSPNLMGQVFVGILFGILYQPQFGLVNRALSWLTHGGISVDTKWLADPNMVMPALVMTALWMYAGFNMVYFLAALQGVDRELYEAAGVDGASGWAQFQHVTIPGIKPVLTFVLVTSTLGSLQLFELPYLLLGNGPGPKNSGLTIVMYLYNNGFVTGDLGYASAIGWTLALGMLVISLVQVRLSGAAKED